MIELAVFLIFLELMQEVVTGLLVLVRDCNNATVRGEKQGTGFPYLRSTGGNQNMLVL